MSNIEDRVTAYEQKLIDAGGTDPLMKGLVKTVRRSQIVLTIAVIGLFLDLVLSGVLIFTATDAHRTADRAELNADRISKNTLVLKQVDDMACKNAQLAARNHNSLVRIIISTDPNLSSTNLAKFVTTLVPVKPC